MRSQCLPDFISQKSRKHKLPYCEQIVILPNALTLTANKQSVRLLLFGFQNLYNFIPNALCTLMLCRMLRSNMISSLPPGIAYARTSR